MNGKKIFLVIGIFLVLSVCFFGCSSENGNKKQTQASNGVGLESGLPDGETLAPSANATETMNPSAAVTDGIGEEKTPTPTFDSDLSTGGFTGEVHTSTPVPTKNVASVATDEIDEVETIKPTFLNTDVYVDNLNTSTPAPSRVPTPIQTQNTGNTIATARPTNTPEVSAIDRVKIGDKVLLGSYEQDNNLDNGNEKIEWIVLGVKDNKALLISKYALDCQIYSDTVENITWGDSLLRKWLNEDFYKAAFSSKDKGCIVSTSTGSEGENGKVIDNVFLLSIEEAELYFKSDAERACVSTEYAVARGATNESGFCFWWLRSPGKMEECAAFVFNLGYIFDYGRMANLGDCGVRPAVWVNMK